MRAVVIVLMLVAAQGLFALDLPSWDDSVTAEKKTVVDYFLLCPDIVVGPSGWLSWGTEKKVDPITFEAKKHLLTPGYTAGSFKVLRVLIDIADAFIQVVGTRGGADYALTFVFFDRKGNSDVPAFSYWGPASDSPVCTMYEINPIGEWLDITSQVLPPLSLEYVDDSPDQPDVYPQADWEYALPRKGTTVLASPRMTPDMKDQGPSDSFDLVKRLEKKKIELLWDRVAGKFTIGQAR